MKNILISGLLFGIAFGMAAPAEAHKRHRHHRHQRTVVVSPWFISWGARQPRVRISENCVWKPWNNRTVCRY